MLDELVISGLRPCQTFSCSRLALEVDMGGLDEIEVVVVGPSVHFDDTPAALECLGEGGLAFHAGHTLA